MMYEKLIKRLKDYSTARKGEIAELTEEAADAIEELQRKERFHAFLWNTIQPNEMEQYLAMYHAGDGKEET